MTHVITYCHDTAELKSKGLALVDAGKYKQYIRRSESGGLDFHKFFVPVAYNSNKSIGYGRLPITDIIGDTENDTAGFLADMGLIPLAYGGNRALGSPHNQIRNNAGPTLRDGARALYQSVIPLQDVTDIDGNPTGEKRLVMIPEVDG